MSYFDDIKSGIRTTVKGLGLTLRHIRNATKRRTPEGVASDNYFDLQNGLVTLQYPHEQLPIPDNGRYRLRNEIDDCIVCDKCAKVCPVDCITIDAIKATEEVGRASDGSPIRLYAAKFDIDMAKCCYCGLCTAVCPTECLTMDKKFDYSEFELGKLTYQFAELTPAEADEKRALYEQFVREKEEAKAAAKADTVESKTPVAAKPKPAFRPTVKPATPPVESLNSGEGAAKHPLTDATPSEMEQIAQGGLETQKHPTFEPADKLVTQDIIRDEVTEAGSPEKAASAADVPKAKPAFRPSMKPPKPASTEMEAAASETPAEPAKPKPAFRPSMRPPDKPVDPTSEGSAASRVEDAPKPKPAFRPTMKPPGQPADAATPTPPVSEAESNEPGQPAAEAPKPKPAFRPTMKPAKSAEPDAAAESTDETPVDAPKAKPAFRPTMKPAKPTDPVDEPEGTKMEAIEEKIDVAPKPAFRPTMKPAKPVEPVDDVKKTEETITPATEPTAAKPKPAFQPTMKPAQKTPPAETTETSASTPVEPEQLAEAAKPKPAFRPTMKPKSAPPSPPSDETSA
ncbi:4Fe-4S dicluster domain-containing protein [Spirosoma sp. KUDC1026]|uniref:4Fe-4S dicluster domain-containing protein n=1 Tax=Spirosoma sp. KUDC1026 TaxID=2745947 RepID=UPI00159B9B25|nr:4Fe-4S dicluster domain-containing protein [Spirosoma sp. KUDC1026]QKZ11417.1 4Fe-4S dicluster domain-containing protein [Spirosoma sp. KUDC1026]